jgi:hypothetical protein
MAAAIRSRALCSGDNEICTNNQCKVCIPLTCANIARFGCGPISNGCGGSLQVSPAPGARRAGMTCVWDLAVRMARSAEMPG